METGRLNKGKEYNPNSFTEYLEKEKRSDRLASVMDKFIEHQQTCTDCRDTCKFTKKNFPLGRHDAEEPLQNLCQAGRYILLDLFV